MRDLIQVQGVVISAAPVGEYDKRIVLLTRERGKISAFAKGARRLNSPFMAAASPFVFGTFTLYEGRTSYNLNQVLISHQFVNLAAMQPGIYYGYYFLELADYFGHEGTDEKEMMNLLFVSAKALLNPRLDDRLIRCVFELRTMAEQGLCPELARCVCCGKEPEEGGPLSFSQEQHGILCGACAYGVRDARTLTRAALYAMRYMAGAPMSRLFAFQVKEEVLGELEAVIHTYVEKNTDRRFKSLQILEIMCEKY